ncbi:MAG TPA: ABA4-like family protein [Polyangiaceae bacterium]|nr:ABA4-like family protein [Polyangiaceae bacterium]
MSDELIFQVANRSVLLPWALLALFPHRTWTRRLVHSGLFCAVLALGYATLLILDYPGPEGANFSSLAGVARIFTSPKTLIAAWVHYLAFDLFVGSWIVRDARRHNLAHAWTLPSLFATLMLGPLGLLSWLGLRVVLLRRVASLD